MQKRLYDFLLTHQRSRKTFTLDEAIEFTGYMASSMRAAISKHLLGVWVTPTDDKHYRVHDFEGVSPAVFADAMTQNTRLSFEDEHSWRAQLKKLLALGIQHQYPVRRAIDSVLAELEVKRR